MVIVFILTTYLLKEALRTSQNKPNGQPAFPLVDGDTFIPGSVSKFNATPCKVRLFASGDTDVEYTFFNRAAINCSLEN